MDSKVTKYGKIYRKVLAAAGLAVTEKNTASYEKRLSGMYSSRNFERHNVYPSVSTPHVYAVIAMCLELKELGMTEDARIIDAVNTGFSARRNFFKRLIRAIDILPWSYRIAERFNISDHERRVKDGSITYDVFSVGEGKIEYSISKCVYVDMFETYGIRSLCRIFCMTDTTAYDNLRRHVTFIRHSTLSDGDCCHDEIIRRK